MAESHIKLSLYIDICLKRLTRWPGVVTQPIKLLSIALSYICFTSFNCTILWQLWDIKPPWVTLCYTATLLHYTVTKELYTEQNVITLGVVCWLWGWWSVWAAMGWVLAVLHYIAPTCLYWTQMHQLKLNLATPNPAKPHRTTPNHPTKPNQTNNNPRLHCPTMYCITLLQTCPELNNQDCQCWHSGPYFRQNEQMVLICSLFLDFTANFEEI